MQSQHVSKVVNGVEVDRLAENVATLRTEPALAKFKFRADNRWISGSRNRSTIKGYYGLGQEDTTRSEPFVMDADEPPVLLGEDSAANPVEHLLHALAACLTTSMVYHAAARGIKIQSLESHLEGDLDLRGFMGISPDVRKGYQSIRVTFRVKSNAPAEKLAELCAYSPVYDTVSRSVPVAITFERA
jgi:uncharacterized OsmC-like protein